MKQCQRNYKTHSSVFNVVNIITCVIVHVVGGLGVEKQEWEEKRFVWEGIEREIGRLALVINNGCILRGKMLFQVTLDNME